MLARKREEAGKDEFIPGQDLSSLVRLGVGVRGGQNLTSGFGVWRVKFTRGGGRVNFTRVLCVNWVAIRADGLVESLVNLDRSFVSREKRKDGNGKGRMGTEAEESLRYQTWLLRCWLIVL